MASLQNLEFLRKFVVAHKAADSPQEVADALGIDKKAVTQITQHLRKKGVELKYFRPRILTAPAIAELQKLV